MSSAVPWICLLLQQCLEGTDPGMPLASGSDHSPSFFPVTTFGISHSAVQDHWDQPTPFFELNSLLLINHELPNSSELFHRGEATVNIHLRAFYTSLSLGFYFNHNDVTLEGMDHFLTQIGQGEVQGHGASLENTRPAQQLCPLSGHAKAISR